MRRPLALVLTLLTAVAAPAARAAGGPLGIDHMLARDETGIFRRSTQEAVFHGLIVASWTGALIEGTQTRLGRTWWRSAEAGTLALAGAQLTKRTFSRSRPREGEGPDAWFQGAGHESFVSGEVSLATAVVAPFIAEYAAEAPAVWALALVPAYVGVARMKSQAHWQTDVLGAVALGVGSAWAVGLQDSPLVLRVLGDGAFVGLRHRW